MSEAGWRAFVDAEDLDDWVVLHGGAAAVYVVPSLADAVRLASAVAEVPGFAGQRSLLTLADGQLSVRLARGVFMLEEADVAVARAVSAVAHEHGATADRSRVQEVQFAVAAQPDDMQVPFWRAVLGYADFAPDNGIDPLGHGSTFWVQELDPAKPLRHAMHVDVSLAQEEAAGRVAAAVAAGGRVVDESEAPWAWILADAAGNKVCVAAWPDGARRPEETTRTETSS